MSVEVGAADILVPGESRERQVLDSRILQNARLARDQGSGPAVSRCADSAGR